MRKCVYRRMLDLGTLVCTRGPNFPLSRLEPSRLTFAFRRRLTEGEAARLMTRYVPGVFMSNSMLKRPAFLRGLLSPQSPSIEPPPVAP